MLGLLIKVTESIVHFISWTSSTQCGECRKWRVCYTARMLKKGHEQQLEKELQLLSYSCGFFFQEMEEHREGNTFDLVFVNNKLTCFSPIEAPYYVVFTDPLCFYCGNEDLRMLMCITQYVMHAAHKAKLPSRRPEHSASELNKLPKKIIYKPFLFLHYIFYIYKWLRLGTAVFIDYICIF